jgi:hypothetical protein
MNRSLLTGGTEGAVELSIVANTSRYATEGEVLLKFSQKEIMGNSGECSISLETLGEAQEWFTENTEQFISPVTREKVSRLKK